MTNSDIGDYDGSTGGSVSFTSLGGEGPVRTYRRVLVVLLLGMVPWWGVVQADPVPYRHYNAFDGLPSAKITALAQTPNGLLWVGTETGLAVYDGEEFRRISFPDSIGTPYVSSIHAMEDGSVWVAPSRGEVAKVRLSGVVTVMDLDFQLAWEILVQQDRILFATPSSIWQLDPNSETLESHPYRYAEDRSGTGVTSAALGPEGIPWVLDGRLGPGRVGANGSVSFVGAPTASSGAAWSALRFTENGTALALRGKSLYRIDKETGAVEQIVDDLSEPTHLAVQGNDVYVTRGHVLLRYDAATKEMRPALGPHLGLPETTPVVALQDRDGGLWIGTHDGLLHLMEPGARQVGSVKGSPIRNVHQFLFRGDVLWARTQGSGLIRLSSPRKRATPGGFFRWGEIGDLDESLHARAEETDAWYRWRPEAGWHYVREIQGAKEGFVGPDGQGYFLHDDGLDRYAPGSDRSDEPLVRWRNPGRHQVELAPAHWPDSESYQHNLAPAPNGDLIHRVNQYIFRRRPDGSIADTVATIPDNDRFVNEGRSTNIRHMRVDATGRIWGAFAYKGGLLRVDPTEDTHRVHLKNRQIWRVDVSGDSLVMASTRQRGLYLLDAQTGTVRRHLTQSDGLKSTAVLTAHLTPDTLYVGHHNGITRMPARGLFRNASSPSVLLTDFEINFEDRYSSIDSLLAAEERNIGISYTGVSLTHSERVQYDVRLLPRDSVWRATSHRFTRYTNLEPGTYRFEVRARLGQQPPGSPTSYSFTVPPHFYESWWFRVLVGIGLVGLGVSAYRWRVRQLERQQHRLQQLVDERTEQLQSEKQKTERQAERLAELDEAKNRFFAHISHEFRTPLSLILSPLREGLRKGRRLGVEQMGRMVRNAERLRRLIDQLLDLATLEAGRMSLEPQPGALVPLVKRTAEAYRSRADEKDIDLTVQTPPGLIESAFDSEKVETMVSNLVGNALKFTPEGGAVTVRMGTADGSGAVEAPGDGAPVERATWIEVVDTGPGIDPEVQSQIFDRFEQVDNSMTREREGTGLGLALTKELVELHGGSIEVESTPGEGSRFTIWLPLVPVTKDGSLSEPSSDDDRLEPAREEFSPAEEPSGDGIPNENVDGTVRGRTGDEAPDEGAATILVVEDNPEMRAYLREELGEARTNVPSSRDAVPWQVMEAADGDEAWEQMQTTPPDLVVSDVMMPGLDGFELCRRIKEDPEWRAVPVLLLTARADQKGTLEGLEVGADDYLPKPFDPEELRRRISNHLAARRHLQEQYQTSVQFESLGATVPEEETSFVEEVMESVGDNLHDPNFTVGRLAGELALSRRQLTRRIKDALDRTPGALIRECRVKRAKELLAQNPATIAEVAYAAGFRSPSSFSETFRKEVGSSPSEYSDLHEDPSSPDG